MTVALVTGGAGGIGGGIAQVFAAAGIDTIVADIEIGRAQAAADRLIDLGGRVTALQLDVASPTSWTATRDAVHDRFGKLDWLVNNAGIAGTVQTDTDQVSFEQWRRTQSVNLDGVFLGCRTFAPGMKAQRSGHIVNTGSIASILAPARCLDYTASKFGVLALSRSLRAELSDHDVGVSVLCPSFVNTRILENSIALDSRNARAMDYQLDEIAGKLARGMDPVDVGRLVLAGIRANVAHIFTNPDERAILEAPAQEMSQDLNWLEQVHAELRIGCRAPAQ